MNRNEQQMYSDITSIRKSLEKIANALEKNNKKEIIKDIPLTVTNEIPGFEGTLDELDNLIPTSSNPDPTGYGNEDDNIKNDSDYDLRVTAKMYECELEHGQFSTKKDCILDYVTNEFGSQGARYTDIIKFAYYLGAPNASKFDSTRDRGYYACALTHGRWNTGHLVTGGSDQLVKGINEDGKERYFTLSFVNNVTDYWKRLDQ